MSQHDELFDELRPLIDRLQGLNEQAIRQYAPIVQVILDTGSRDTPHIEHTLDTLLDLCAYPPALELFRRLCRHYWQIDPAATAFYVGAYRETWDSPKNDLPSPE